MTEIEYRLKVLEFEREIERNKKLRCMRVAAKYERWLAALKKEHGGQEDADK